MLSITENIEKRLRFFAPHRDETLFEAARYALFSGGKRFRPLLTMATCGVLGKDPLFALDTACAIEMIHTYSLIHDDLPCIDDDAERRGRPSLHKVYGEAIALLTGNHLLTFAFEIIADDKNTEDVQKAALIKILSQQSGAFGMIGGQALDIESREKILDEEILTQIHLRKTSALICASFLCANILANTSFAPLLLQIGKELGLAYQLQDDLFDEKNSFPEEKTSALTLLGKPTVERKIEELKYSLWQKLALLPNQGSQLAILLSKIFGRAH